MNILVITQHFYPENFGINGIVKNLASQGHNVTVLTGIPNVPKGKYFKGYSFVKKYGSEGNIYDGARVERVRIISRGTRPLRWVVNCISYVTASLLKLRKLRNNNYDLIFVYQVSPISQLIPARWLKKHSKAPVLTYVLDIWPESLDYLLHMKKVPKIADKLLKNYCNKLYHVSDKILVSSKQMRSHFSEIGFIAEKVQWLPQTISNENGELTMDDEEYQEVRKKYNLKQEDLVITFAGNFGPAQNLQSVLQIAEKLQNIPQFVNVKIVLAGTGSEYDTIQRIIQEKQLQNVTLTGFLKQNILDELIEVTDICLVSVEDAPLLDVVLPAKVQYYMSQSKPILSLGGLAVKELLDENKGGWWCESDKIDAAVDNILEILRIRNSGNLIPYGKRNKVYFDENFSEDIIYQKLNEALTSVIQDP